MVVKDTGSDFVRPEPGMQQAVCSKVYDLGMVPGFEGKITHKLIILWELEERIKDGDFKGQRFTVSKFFTASLGEKATLRGFLVSWRGREFTPAELKGFEMDKIIGVNCYLNLVEKDKTGGGTTITVAAVAPFKAKEGLERMVPELEVGYCPDWIKKLMTKEGLPGEPGGPNIEPNSEIPF